ncbi:MAG: amidohydrolase family protein [Planctomycetaceae bacterium]|nr:amidohydrolase family protein [Planctomycetaceae bacterium]
MIAALLLPVLLAQAAPADADCVVITGVRILTVSHGEIEAGTLILHGDKIGAVGADVQPPPGAKVLDRKGLTVFPGILNPLSRLGMPDAAGAAGSAQHLAADEFNPVSEAIGPAARSGVTLFALQPSGGGFAGQGAFVKPVGWTRPQQMLEKAAFLRLVLQPGSTPKDALKQGLEGARKAFDADRKKIDDKTAALVQFLKGDLVCIAEAGTPAELLHFWQLLDSIPDCTPKVVIAATGDVYKAAADLGARKARVILRPALSLAPFTRERINTAAELDKAGVQIAFAPLTETRESLEGMFFRVGELVKYGLSREAGLRALTLSPAEMLGVDRRVGSLEAGKDADFLLLTGDPLSPLTRIQEVYINGRPVVPGE